MSRWKCCNNLSANTAQEKGERRKRTSHQAWTGTYTLSRSSATLAIGPSHKSFISHRLMFRSLEDLRLKAGTVCDDNGLSSHEQCLQRGYYNVSTCSQRTWTSMARQRQLTPSTTGSWVDATRCRPLSPLPSHTVPALRHRFSSSRCIRYNLKFSGDFIFVTFAKIYPIILNHTNIHNQLPFVKLKTRNTLPNCNLRNIHPVKIRDYTVAAHLWLVHKVMGDKGFGLGLIARVAEAPWKSVGHGFKLGCWSFFSCRLSPEQCLQRDYYNMWIMHACEYTNYVIW